MLINVFSYRFKNSIKVIRNTVIAYFIIFSILTATCVAVSFVIKESNAVNKINIAIVENDDDKLTEMAIRYISQMDSVKSVSNFVKYTRDDAFEELENGNVRIILDIPTNFYDAVNNGENPHLAVYIYDDSNVVTRAFANIIKSGVEDVAVTEATVYSFLNVRASGQYEIKELSVAPGDYIAMIFADIIMHRTRLFSDSVVSYYGQIDMGQYYFCSLVCIFIFLICGSFGFLYQENNNAVSDKLKIHGISGAVNTNINILITWIFSLIISWILCFLAMIVTRLIGYDDFEIGVMFFITLLISSLVAAIVVNGFYYLAGAGYIGNIAFICIFIVLFASCGCVVPANLLPGWCGVVSRINPVGWLFELLIQSCSDTFSVSTCGLLLIVVVIVEGLVLGCKKR